MSQIQIRNLTFSYGTTEVFRDASVTLDTDWRLGLCGRNGRGKTTLLRLLMGELEFEGSISHSTAFEYFPPTTTHSGTVLEVACLHAEGAEEWEVRRELKRLALDEWQYFDHLSKGEQTKTLLASLFAREGRFLLIDEPTNHLDAEGRRAVSAYLATKRGYIVISHDRAFLDGCVDHVLSINRSSIELVKGNYSTWERERARINASEQAQNERLNAQISRLSGAIARTSEWASRVEAGKYDSSIDFRDTGFIGHKSAKMSARAKSIQKRKQSAIDQKSQLLLDVERDQQLKIHPLEYFCDRLVTATDLSIRYGDRTVCSNISFEIAQGEILAIVGANGSGKTSILSLVAGDKIGFDGTLNIGSRLVISRVLQAEHLVGSQADYARNFDLDTALFFAILAKLGFEQHHFDIDLSALSQGQKKKVMLARSLATQAHLYIWDEPLNYLDIPARIMLESLLKSFHPTILLVEHDTTFLKNTATKTLEL